MDTREKIIEFLRVSGPIIPIQLARELKTNILMSSAFLSELVSSGKARISAIKIGGSPLYYLPGHEYKLQNFSIHLNEKERKAYEEISKKKVLSDKLLEPFMRVAIRELRDFAVSLQFQDNLYWRWYLLPPSDAESIIKNKFLTEIKKPDIEDTAIKIQASNKNVELQDNNNISPIIPQIQTIQEQKPIAEIKSEKTPLQIITTYFSQNNIEVMDLKSKKNDIECKIKLHTQIGDILCYCRARFKKTITDADISSAYLQSQYRALPLLFLYSGSLTKKAEKILKEYPTIIIKRI